MQNKEEGDRVMTTRLEYHKRRIQRVVAKVMQNFYDNFGDEDQWDSLIFEEQQKCINAAKEQINKEDGFPPDFA